MSPILAHQSYRKACGFSGHILKASAAFSGRIGLCGGTPAPPPDLSAGVVKSTDNPASGPLRSTAGHRIVSRPRRPRRLKGVAKLVEGPELEERPSAEMSSVHTQRNRWSFSLALFQRKGYAKPALWSS